MSRLAKPIAFLSLLPLLLAGGPAAAAPMKMRLSLCDAGTLFLIRDDGGFWDALSPPDRYVVEVSRVSEDVAGGLEPLMSSPAAFSDADPTFLRAAFPHPLPAGERLRVLLRGAEAQEIGVADLSTKPARASIRPSGALAEAHFRFEITSPAPLRRVSAAQATLVEVLRKSLIEDASMKVTGERVKEHTVDIIRQPPENPSCETPAVSGGPSGGISGGMIVDLKQGDRLSERSAALRLTGLTDVFGQPVTVEGDLVPAKVPKGKEDAFAYSKALFESAKGSDDALTLDLKVQPVLQMAGRWLFRPDLAATVSRNSPATTNSIRLAALFSRTTVRREVWTVANTYSLGPSLESDRNFDRVNAILDVRWQPEFRGLYRARETQRLVTALKLNRKPEEIALPRTGWGLDGLVALEAGGSLSDQTVGKLEIDRYDILRLRPLAHGFVEIGPVTFDASSTLRYLFKEELSYDQKPDGTLRLRPVKGSRPYTEASLAVAFDPAKHLNLAVTYKSGSEPPLFRKVDKYSLGIVAKY